MSKQIAPTGDIGQFCDLINKGVEAWVAAGKLLVKMVKSDGHVFDKITAAHPNLTFDILSTFERIGRDEIYPYLLVDGSPGARKLAGLPYDSQVEIYNGTVDVVTKGISGFKIEHMKIHDMTAVQAARVFDVNRIRSVNEQQKLLAAQRRPRYYNPAARRPRSEVEIKDPEPEEEEPSVPGVASLDDDPKTELAKILTRVHTDLLDARTALAILKQNSPCDIFITRALTEVGHLRLAVNEGEL
jgi:hypothetical protein